jgi:hypothetical protein
MQAQRIGFLTGAIWVIATGNLVAQSPSLPTTKEAVAHLKPTPLDRSSTLARYTGMYWRQQSRQPGDLLDLPQGIQSRTSGCRFFTLNLRSRSLFAVIQVLSPKNVRVWVDSNLNRRLSDEKVINGSLKSIRRFWRLIPDYLDFGSVQISSNGLRFASFHLIADTNARRLQTLPMYSYTSRIMLRNTTYEIAVVDGDFDGKFTSLYKPTPGYAYGVCDMVAMALNPTGVPMAGKFQYTPNQISPLGRYVKPDHNNAQLYRIHVSEDDSVLHAQPAQANLGTLKIPKNTRLSCLVYSDAVSQLITFEDEIKLPIGHYQLMQGNVSYSDKTGKQWQLSGDFRNDRRKGQFEIKEGDVFSLNPGPPFKVVVDIDKRGGDSLSIGASLTGREGEKYSIRLNQTMARPRLRIIAENGKRLHSGFMEYG